MTQQLTSTLESSFDDVVVGRRLHDVPPYRVYEGRLDGRQAAVKVDAHPRGHAADEGRVHEFVATQTGGSVPAVLAVGSDHYATAWDDALDRSPATIDSEWAAAAGRWLGTVHAETAGVFDGFGRLRNDGSGLELEAHDDWLEAVRARLSFHRSFLEPIGYATVVDAVDQFFETHDNAFDGAGEPVLCHGDIHPEHLARTGDGPVAIDFEHALVAPGEYDYWRTVIPYFEPRDDVDDSVRRSFRHGYESVRSLPNGFEYRKPVYRAFLIVAFIESLHLQQHGDPTLRASRGDQFRELAFETLETLHDEFDCGPHLDDR
ncbi:aminoglycoside phosphotransferase family protein [Natrialba asiatica]|uniref:Aminoglycoside phosphotransferase n=1 Tax=Natrialba asiatica (strain ATCC 700177 / DSM 12278 / JCM 9576 / FERM P-10747 / NBRC 102637 / 172P1) TaxID=29540 RepID=M0B2T9_NATA1|nr:aminoglycoside phosphotransferase family protein [Natrialba asiatica]ELZ04877.1 aminoglycoside phosphotransferase [Natrialba asiatica DSM 12278]